MIQEAIIMDEMLGTAFQALARIGGGSEVVPLVVFCVVLVLLGLGIGLAAMRLLRKIPTSTEPEPNTE